MPPVRSADPSKAFVPPPDWTPPPGRAPEAMPVAAPPPPAEPVTVTPTPPPVMATPAPPPMPAAPIEGNIATAQSGAVPFSDIKSPPFGGPMQVAVIQFGRASSGLGENDYSVLAKVAQIQRRNGGTIRVVAHADQDAYGNSADQLERGNFEVSRRRALAVAQQLRALGVPRDRIVAEAASDDEPVYQTNTARGIAANRRAEVYIDF
jgi:outer membrane protein OmpA-like peptidoglycan-associated protein